MKMRFHATCVECAAEGAVKVETVPGNSQQVKHQDRILHETWCSRHRRPQPRHLRSKQWREQERRANKLTGARETLMSGAVGEDGDGRTVHEWRMEAKRSKNARVNIHQNVWHKLVSGALDAGEEPYLHVELTPLRQARHRVVVVRKDYYDAAEGWPEPLNGADHMNRVSFRIDTAIQAPTSVDLDPAGVAMPEAYFKALKGDIDGRSQTPTGRAA